MTALRVEDADHLQPSAGQGELCASCRSRASGQMCARDAEEPNLARRRDGTEWCDLFEDVREATC